VYADLSTVVSLFITKIYLHAFLTFDMCVAFCCLVSYDNIILSEAGYCRNAFYTQTSTSARQWTTSVEHIITAAC